MSDFERLKPWLRINLTPNVGPVTFDKLLQRWKTPENILIAPRSELEEICRKDVARSLASSDAKTMSRIEREISDLGRYSADILTYHDDKYPEALAHIKSYPPLLYYQGSLEAEDVSAVAIVGSRNAGHSALRFTRNLAGDLANRGFTVVSGMARGIDTEAHHGALEAGGRTIAVMGCGLDIVYPSENKSLKERISRQGAVVTEFPFGTRPERMNFPRRNRIISGLSLGVVVIEAGIKSGALITAKYAIEHNREVMAVPGDVRNPGSRGVNQLIKQGAKLVESVDDIVDALPLWASRAFGEQALSATQEPKPESRKSASPRRENPKPAAKPVTPRLNENEQRIFSILQYDPIHIDMITTETGLTVGPLSQALLELELKGLVIQQPGKFFVRA